MKSIKYVGTRVESRVHGFKKLDLIPEPITCSYDRLGSIYI
jgi:hypothetical protein